MKGKKSSKVRRKMIKKLVVLGVVLTITTILAIGKSYVTI